MVEQRKTQQQPPERIWLNDREYLEEVSTLAKRWGLSRQQARHLLLDLEVPLLCLHRGEFFDPNVLTDVIKDMLAWRSVGYAAPGTRARQYPERYGNPATSVRELNGELDEDTDKTETTNEPEKPVIEITEPPASVGSGGDAAATIQPPPIQPIMPDGLKLQR